jgi:hypothetical protein
MMGDRRLRWTENELVLRRHFAAFMSVLTPQFPWIVLPVHCSDAWISPARKARSITARVPAGKPPLFASR